MGTLIDYCIGRVSTYSSSLRKGGQDICSTSSLAGMAELVDAPDSKSGGHCPWEFESPSRHHSYAISSGGSTKGFRWAQHQKAWMHCERPWATGREDNTFHSI